MAQIYIPHIDIYIHICFTLSQFVITRSNRELRSFVAHCFVCLHIEYIFSTQSLSSAWGKQATNQQKGSLYGVQRGIPSLTSITKLQFWNVIDVLTEELAIVIARFTQQRLINMILNILDGLVCKKDCIPIL